MGQKISAKKLKTTSNFDLFYANVFTLLPCCIKFLYMQWLLNGLLNYLFFNKVPRTFFCLYIYLSYVFTNYPYGKHLHPPQKEYTCAN